MSGRLWEVHAGYWELGGKSGGPGIWFIGVWAFQVFETKYGYEAIENPSVLNDIKTGQSRFHVETDGATPREGYRAKHNVFGAEQTLAIY